jgi:hypothetical protein
MKLSDAVKKYRLVKRLGWSGSFVLGSDGAEYRFDEKLLDYVKYQEFMELRLDDAIAEDWMPTRNENEETK